jgi:hypothetical protein
MEQNLLYSPSDVIGRECKNITYSTDEAKENDCVLVKEVIHTNDGRQIPQIRIAENVKRPVYITQKHHQNHTEKKEYEERGKCQELMTTDVQMSATIQLGLGFRFVDKKKSLRQVCTSPFVYWADLTLPTYIKNQYLTKWPDAVSENRLCIIDVETNVREGRDREPNIMSFILDDEIHFFGDKPYMDRIGKDADQVIARKAKELLTRVPFLKKDKVTGEEKWVEVDVLKDYKLFVNTCATPGQCIVMMFNRIHERLPDLVVAWNHQFDHKCIIDQLALEGIPAEDVYNHPDVPKQYRRCWFKEDQANKKTESKSLTKSPADQWHVMYCMASFYCVDAMCLFKKIRTHEGNRPNYKLSSILETEIGVGKLNIPGLDYTDNLAWHEKAQTDFPAEYAVYNIMDNLLITLLDAKTKDLASAFSVLAGVSMFDIFPSLPKRICNAYTFYLYKQGLVIGSVGSAMRNEKDEEVIGTDGWIVTLPAHMNQENGLRDILAEIPDFYSAFRGQTADADLTQAYPSATNMMNQSRETTLIELIYVNGVNEEVRRRVGVNLTAGRVNAMEIATDFFLLPDKDTVLEAFMRRVADQQPQLH